MWTCKQCKSEVEDSFEICWNCRFDKSGSLSTWESISNGEKETKNQTTNGGFLTKSTNIVAAGKAIKDAVYGVIVNVICLIIAFIITYLSKDIESIHMTYLVLGCVSLFCNVYILLKFYLAGDFLENSGL